MSASTSHSAARILPLMQHAASGYDFLVRLDAHCHLGLMKNGANVATQAAEQRLLLFSMGVEPSTFAAEHAQFASCPHVEVGLGLHPWYIEPENLKAQLNTFEEQLPYATLVGEIGLDFGAAHAHTADAQIAAFARILELVARGEGRCLSVHAVRSAGTMLDMLEESNMLACTRNSVIFHWFSGTSDELHRAIALGAWFSVGERMLATRRGRSYVRSIPAERLLLETDSPVHPDDVCSADELSISLSNTANALALIR